MTWDELVESAVARHPGTAPGQMFGVPCVKRDGKVAACLWKDGGIAVKLVEERDREEALALDGADFFDPGMGRPMREWIHVPAAQSGQWERLLDRALATLSA